MIFSYQTKTDAPIFVQHAGEAEAVSYLLDSVLGDAARGDDPAFWASRDGTRLIQADRRLLDYSACVCPSFSSAVAVIQDGDPAVLASDLRALADA